MTTPFRIALSAVMMAATAIPTTNHVVPEADLSAPTYYIAAEVVGCSQDTDKLEFRGATNLPQGALIGASVVDFTSGTKSYSDEMYVPVDEAGFFAGELGAKKGMHFRYGITLQVVFAPFRPKQPDSVLKVIGKHGEKLGQVANIKVKVSEGFERPAANPQVMHWSGDIYGLWATSVLPNCGEKPN